MSNEQRSKAQEVLEDQVLPQLPAAVKAPADCGHEDFAAAVAVGRLEDVGIITAEIRIVCVQCHVPMRFLGAPAGWHPRHPTSSIDGLELNAPIEAELEKQLQASASFTLPAKRH